MNFLSILCSNSLLTSELFYVGINSAIQRNLWNLTNEMIILASNMSISTDFETLNSTLQLLIRHDRVIEAWNIIQLTQQHKFGVDVKCDKNVYLLLLTSASLHGFNSIVLSVIDIIIDYSDRKYVNTMSNSSSNTSQYQFNYHMDSRLHKHQKESLFLSSLNACVLKSKLLIKPCHFMIDKRFYCDHRRF